MSDSAFEQASVVAQFTRFAAFICGTTAVICAGWNPLGIATPIEQLQIILLGGFMVFWGINKRGKA
jgi:hypothetical protein